MITVHGYQFKKDLTIGSTGKDVVELQTLLIKKGLLVMPAGVPKGYFGHITRVFMSSKPKPKRKIPRGFGRLRLSMVPTTCGDFFIYVKIP